ncbi:MAG: PepSY domain-containing protein [Defluviitaleaceae bacterium]|nr:PepSY domain-containing protein [Defluviitaleaceae bacterium]
MLKKIKWGFLILASISIILLTYVVTLVRYAESDVTLLEAYHLSLMALPEVVAVRHIHRFNGLNAYIVAEVEHESGEDVYFFVYEASVAYYFFRSQLIDEQAVRSRAQALIGNGQIINSQLGMLNGVPIFEVQLTDEDVIHYVVIDAQNGEVIMSFYM